MSFREETKQQIQLVMEQITRVLWFVVCCGLAKVGCQQCFRDIESRALIESGLYRSL